MPVSQSTRIALTLIFAVGLMGDVQTTAVAQANQASDSMKVESVQLGLNGVYRVGRWTPLTVQLDQAVPAGAKLVIEAPDPDGNPTSIDSSETVGTNGLYGEFRVGRLDSSIRVRIEDADGNVLLRHTVRTADSGLADALPAAIELAPHVVVSVGEATGFSALDADSLSDITQLLFADETHSVEHIQLQASELPTGDNGLEAADVIVLASDFQLSAAQINAIDTWVRAGGHLIVSAGSNVETYHSSPLARLLNPIFTVEPQPISTYEVTGLESFSGRSLSVNINKTTGQRKRVSLAKVEVAESLILIQGREGALALQSALGFGKVSFLAFNINEDPVSTWDALPVACHRLIFGRRFKKSEQSRSGPQRISQSGVTDISTQLMATQGGFEGVDRASSWTVMGMMLLYLLLIGPVDYFIVHKILRRPHWTWVTFPLLVAGGAFIALSAAKDRNGDQLQVNHLEILDVNPTSEDQSRGTSIFSIYSPTSQRLQATANVKWGSGGTARTSWTGVAENIFGGMYRSGSVAIGRAPYSFSNSGQTIDNLPIQTWSTQRLVSEWQLKQQVKVDSQLTSTAMGVINGSFSHDLPFTIDNWLLAYSNRVYGPLASKNKKRKTELAPGRRWSPGTSRELRSFLTGIKTRSIKSREGVDANKIVLEQSDYDSLSRDPEYVVRMLTFHSIAGGTQYTGLRNDLLRNLDLSDVVGTENAVLFGTIKDPQTSLSLDSTEQQPTSYAGFIRLIVPVKRISTQAGQLLELKVDLRKSNQPAPNIPNPSGEGAGAKVTPPPKPKDDKPDDTKKKQDPANDDSEPADDSDIK